MYGLLASELAASLIRQRPFELLLPPNHILLDTMVSTSTLSTSPLTLPPSANPAHFADFGRQVEGVDLETADDATLAQVRFLLSLLSTPTSVSGWTY